LKWEYPAPNCLNTAEINRLAGELGLGEVFRIETVGDGISQLTVNHPSKDSPAFFAMKDPGRYPQQCSDQAREVGKANIAAWIALTENTRNRTSTNNKVRRDKETEARDKWIYRQCCKGTPHDAIVAELRRIADGKGWRRISTKNRVWQIGREYAERHGLEPPPPRQNL
jgi:hypothetical protein